MIDQLPEKPSPKCECRQVSFPQVKRWPKATGWSVAWDSFVMKSKWPPFILVVMAAKEISSLAG